MAKTEQTDLAALRAQVTKLHGTATKLRAGQDRIERRLSEPVDKTFGLDNGAWLAIRDALVEALRPQFVMVKDLEEGLATIAADLDSQAEVPQVGKTATTARRPQIGLGAVLAKALFGK